MFVDVNIEVDTLTQSSEEFSIDSCVGFTIENNGATNVNVGYKGRSKMFLIPAGTSRTFQIPSGYQYKGVMDVAFATGQGDVSVIKHMTVLQEDWT